MLNRILAALVILVALVAVGFFVMAYQQRNAAIDAALNSADATLTAIHD